MGLGVFHHHPFTGMPCDCGYGRPKFVRRTERTAGVNWNRAVKNQVGGKKFQIIEDAPKFIAWMNELMQDDHEGWRDEIAPFLVKEFRSGNVTFNENRQAFYRLPAGEARLSDGIVDRWGRWASSRQHPTRRGINVTGPDLTTMNIRWQVDPFFEDMQRREEHQRKIEAMQESDAPVVYEFNDGWTVRDLAAARHPDEEMGLEGQIMDHCIGNDGEHPHTGYSYIDAVHGGDISHVYSIRDPDGMPHVTLHMNAADGSLAEIHGYNDQDDALRKYAPRAAHFLRERHPDTMKPDADSYAAEDMRSGHYPWQAVGNLFGNPNDEYGDPESEYESSYDVQGATSMGDVREQLEAMNAEPDEEGNEHEYIHANANPDYFDARENGEAPDLNFDEPNWHMVVDNMVDDPSEDVGSFLTWLRTAKPQWLADLREVVQHYGTAELQGQLAHQDREAEIEQKVNEMFPGAADPARLFNAVPDRDPARGPRDPWSEDQYAYQVTDPDLGLAEDQYLDPTDKQYFIDRRVRQKMKAMRDEGHDWRDIAREHGAGGYDDGTNRAQRSLLDLRQKEYEEMRKQRRDILRFVKNREETDAPRDPRDPEGMFIPWTMEEVQNKARQFHWQDMVNSGLPHDAASRRIIEYERQVRNNPDHCQECGLYNQGSGIVHLHDCPVDPATQAQIDAARANQQWQRPPAGEGGTLSRVAMAFPGDLYHVSPASNRQAIMSEGLRAHEPGHAMYNPTGWGQGIRGNYAFEDEKDAVYYAHHLARQGTPMDVWRLRNTGALPVEQDPETYMFGYGGEIPREEAPQPHQFDTGAEMGLDADEDPAHNPTFYWHRPEPDGWSEEDDGNWYEDDASMEQVGGRQMAWRIPAHVPPEQLQHVRHVNPGDATWEEHWMGDALQGWTPDHMAPEPYHRVEWGSPQEYQDAVKGWQEHRRGRTAGWGDTDPADAEPWS